MEQIEHKAIIEVVVNLLNQAPEHCVYDWARHLEIWMQSQGIHDCSMIRDFLHRRVRDQGNFPIIQRRERKLANDAISDTARSCQSQSL